MSEKVSRPARRAYRRQHWSATVDALFFAQLAETANVRHAAETAGVTPSAAYTRRQNDPVFAARWATALEEGYARLEMMLLDQSVNGFERVETVADGEGAVKQVKTVRSFPHVVALHLLRTHRDTVERYRALKGAQGEEREAGERLRAELGRVRARLKEEDTNDG